MARTKTPRIGKKLFLAVGIGSVILGFYREGFLLVAIPSFIISSIFQEIENGK